jgi:ABC-type multidrug transport system fused ATPase/permease subunit
VFDAAARYTDLAVGSLWPLGYETAPTWITILVGIFSLFLYQFAGADREAEKASEAKKLKRCVDLMTIMRADIEKKAKTDGDPMEGVPEASRLLTLLWDDVAERTMASYGAPEAQTAYFSALLRQKMAAELKETVSKTVRARELGVTKVGKEEQEFLSGEKLKEKLEFVKGVRKNLGKAMLDQAQFAEGEKVMRQIVRSASSKRTLLKLLGPCLPALALAIPANMAGQGLQSVYYQIGRWNRIGEAASAGDMDMVMYWVVEIGIGHVLVWFFEMMSDAYETRATGVFGYNLRTSVLRSLLQQDYEYFDKNPSGVLQERLNRDADLLGRNLIALPMDITGQATKASIALIQVYYAVPRWMFLVCVAPLPVVIVLGRLLDTWRNNMLQRSRKLTEEAAATTGEVLKEIRTVRQFANEDHEVYSYSRTESFRNQLHEHMEVVGSGTGKIMGVIIVSGLCLTCYLGSLAVQAGEMTSGLVMDTAIKVNFFVVFPTRHVISCLPKLTQALEPLGRICELLNSTPGIENKAGPHKVMVRSAAEFNRLVGACETVQDKRGVWRTRLATPVQGLQAAAGSMLTECVVPSGNTVRVHAKAEIPQNFPMELHFSRHIVPLHFRGEVEFCDVHFSFPNDLRKPILRGTSFKVEPGQKVALVGEAGCGKSTCMALCQRLYDPMRGVILIDGTPMPEYDIKFLRRRIVLVEQKPVLFSATVRDNICYGLDEDVSDERVEAVLREASMWEGDNGIASKPDKLLTKLGTNGISLSGGQTQRVAIARAMIRDPDVILLDEATSALDNRNEKIVQEALDRLARKGSALVIAHRLTTIKDSDKICVFKAGKLVEEGTHDDLLQRTIVRERQASGEDDVIFGIYRFLWELQFATDADKDVTIAETLKEMDAEEPDTSESDSKFDTSGSDTTADTKIDTTEERQEVTKLGSVLASKGAPTPTQTVADKFEAAKSRESLFARLKPAIKRSASEDSPSNIPAPLQLDRNRTVA